MMKKWEILSSENTPKDPDAIVNLLLKQRGIITEKDRKVFLDPDLADVTPEVVKLSSPEITKTLKRLQKAKDNKELIIVYGDYDVDGITGTAILWESLIALGFEVMPYIPHRVDEGYGLSKVGIANVCQQFPNVKLIITVDNGIVASDAVEFANNEKIDVIITDHHLPDEKGKPDAFAIVHTTQLCGAGVAWLLAKEIQKKFGSVGKDDQDVHLELAALATVADMVPLTGANRTIVRQGITNLRKTERFGLVALFLQAALEAGKIGTYEIGHVIGPRLNASGRLESAMDSLRLLCTRDKKRARALAEQLEVTNTARQQIMRQAILHASSEIRTRGDDQKILIIASETYEEGIIGLVAGRLVEEFYKPSIVIARGAETSKGSVRSVSGFNIIKFLRSKPELFLGVGGHPMAAGFSIKTDMIDNFRKTLEEYASELIEEEVLQRKVKIDLEIDLNSISDVLYQKIQSLAPFGMGNPEPTFLSKHVLVRQKKLMGKEGKHLRLIVQGGEMGQVMEAVAFGMGERVSEIQEEGYIDIVYILDENEWNGTKRLQLKVKDFRVNEN